MNSRLETGVEWIGSAREADGELVIDKHVESNPGRKKQVESNVWDTL